MASRARAGLLCSWKRPSLAAGGPVVAAGRVDIRSPALQAPILLQVPAPRCSPCSGHWGLRSGARPAGGLAVPARGSQKSPALMSLICGAPSRAGAVPPAAPARPRLSPSPRLAAISGPPPQIPPCAPYPCCHRPVFGFDLFKPSSGSVTCIESSLAYIYQEICWVSASEFGFNVLLPEGPTAVSSGKVCHRSTRFLFV